MKKSHTTKSGFTLLELLVTTIVLGVLAAIVVPTARSMVTDAKAARMMQTIKIIADASRQYFANTGVWPGTAGDLWTNPGIAGWNGPYLERPIGIEDNPFGQPIHVMSDSTTVSPQGADDSFFTFYWPGASDELEQNGTFANHEGISTCHTNGDLVLRFKVDYSASWDEILLVMNQIDYALEPDCSEVGHIMYNWQGHGYDVPTSAMSGAVQYAPLWDDIYILPLSVN